MAEPKHNWAKEIYSEDEPVAVEPETNAGHNWSSEIYIPDEGQAEVPEDRVPMGDRLMADYEKRKMEVADTFEAFSKGSIGTPSMVLQTVGKGAFGPVVDAFGEVFTEALEYVPDTVKEFATDALSTLGDTELGQEALQAMNTGMEAWAVFKEGNPQAAKDIESASLIAMFAGPRVRAGVKSATDSMKGGVTKPAYGRVRTIARRVEKASRSQRGRGKSAFVDDLVRQPQTKQVLSEQVPRQVETGRGMLRRTVTIPSEIENEARREVLKVAGVGPKNTVLGNYNLIDDHLKKSVDSLSRKLEKADVSYQPGVKHYIRNKVRSIVDDNPIVQSDQTLVNTTTRVLNKVDQLMESNPKTVSGLLKARKELDAWLRSSKSSDFFASPADTALSVSGRAGRNAINDVIDSLYPGVKDTLRHQSALLNALENIRPKAADMAPTAIRRAFERAASTLPLRSKVLQQAALLGGTTAIAAAERLTPIAVAAGATYGAVKGAHKLLTGPALKNAAAATLKAVDQAMLMTNKPRSVVSAKGFIKKNVKPRPGYAQQLMADKAALIEIMKFYEEDQNGN